MPQEKAAYFESTSHERHTLKAQVMVDQGTGQIICTAFDKGRVHDFRLFKQFRLPMLPEQLCLADKASPNHDAVHL